MIENWRPISKKSYTHSIWRKILDVEFEMPDGKRRTYSLKEEGEVVAVFAMDKNNQIILTRQFRPGPMEVIDEIPGGCVDEGEDPETAAARELLEETGYQAGRIKSLGTVHECAYSTIQRSVYIALECEKVSDQNLDDGEFIEVVKKSIPEFIQQLMSGDCTDPEVGWMALYDLGIIKQVL